MTSDLSNGCLTPPHMHSDTMTRKHWAGFFTSTLQRPRWVSKYLGGNLQPETGWLQTGGGGGLIISDGWGRWFVEGDDLWSVYCINPHDLQFVFRVSSLRFFYRSQAEPGSKCLRILQRQTESIQVNQHKSVFSVEETQTPLVRKIFGAK